MIPMRPFDVLCNLKNWTSWDYKAYKLQENEAHSVIKALENYIWHDFALEGPPKEPGAYLIKLNDGGYIPYIVNAIHENHDMDWPIELYSKWRKIIDEEEPINGQK